MSLAKYHAIVLVMRGFEYVAEKIVNVVVLDKLTMDTFECARRKTIDEGKQGYELVKDMGTTCFYANLIAFLADYTVHQAIMLYGYYVYIQEQRRRRKQKRLADRSGSAADGRELSGTGDELHSGALALSLLKKSTLLFLSRGVGLVFCSAGGAVGSMWPWPGWGCVAGCNLGDTAAASLTEEMTDISPAIV